MCANYAGSILPLRDFIHISQGREVREESRKMVKYKEETISCKACGGGTCFTLGSACRDNKNVRHKSCGGCQVQCSLELITQAIIIIFFFLLAYFSSPVTVQTTYQGMKKCEFDFP